ncbi:NAD(P)-dependent dehydrogenase, short-chain alcohol dehydrogenase family [Vibrio xiamenensis]|uniref:NAD(P)-dependent dehydrogenase, short-chain alcohol dehydrogenase family n=1 Tax=Vibrio xiamenensis TaxID=861298 RepID=A0A1G7WXL4_9VIBR|nr:SDR family oxidoreductase [Vibrio xiamenensis]SDG76669.1 NAD(P)-dependent dehydrogenase, short-chain alcohol dehydrogenase family [Vibrio xiamenensis]SDG87976.1 NAD(P)-dependent dehydrogenase, short-chain alcohol dehydrogenase family [Vibrio xiamenensis]
MSQLALITGGSRGLGRAGALALADQGVDIIVTYHQNQSAAQQVVAEIEAKGRKALALQCDTRDVASFAAFAEQLQTSLKSHFGRERLDYLLNNAGTGIHAMVEQTSVEQLDEMYNIHVKGPFFFTQAILDLIEKGGHIVNVSSGLARFTFPGSGPYAMAKGAVEVMTRYMAKEFAARGIRVNTLAPGAIATDFRGGAIRDNDQAQTMVASVTALGRVGEAEDIGKIIAGLFSQGFEWVTGQRIEASGGMML